MPEKKLNDNRGANCGSNGSSNCGDNRGTDRDFDRASGTHTHKTKKEDKQCH